MANFGEYVATAFGVLFPNIFIVAVVGGGINVWFISDIADVAQEYYEAKCIALCGINNST